MAKCNRKTLNGIFGAGGKLGFDIDDLRAMTSTGHLSEIGEPEAARILQTLRDQQARGDTGQGSLAYASREGCGRARTTKIWRLYSSSALAREINCYVSMIEWKGPGGFRAWLKKCFKIEQLEWVDSFMLATNIKNALKRMYHEQQRKETCVE